MSNFWKRTLFGAIFVSIMVGSILIDKYSFLIVFFLLNLFSLYEFYNKSSQSQKSWVLGLGLLAGSLLFVLIAFWRLDWLKLQYILLFLVPGFLFYIASLLEKDENAFLRIGQALAGIFLITVPFTLLVWISLNHGAYSWQIVLLPLVLTWINDTFAYLSGMLFGKHLLAPKLTPKKTYEGFIGGVLFTTIAAWIFSLYIDRANPMVWIMLGLTVSLASVLGDFIESKWKRGLGIKDSGSIIPGHGGLLDRFDAFLLVIPFYVLFLKIFAA